MTYANRGKQLEAAVERVCDSYAEHGTAYIVKAATAWTVIGWDPRTGHAAKVFPAKKGTVDYYGSLPRGRSIYFDAKETKGKRFPLKNVHEHQTDFLLRMMDFGAIVFFLVYFTDIERCFMVDPALVMQTVKSGKASLSIADIEGSDECYECPVFDGEPDFLYPLMEG